MKCHAIDEPKGQEDKAQVQRCSIHRAEFRDGNGGREREEKTINLRSDELLKTHGW